MKKTIALKENHEFRRLYHRGTSSAGRHLVLYCRKNRLGHNRLGLTVSAKLACAVKRNRIKRLFREAYRLHEDEFATGVDLVLVARARAVGATYQDIEKSLLRALRENKAAAAQPRSGCFWRSCGFTGEISLRSSRPAAAIRRLARSTPSRRSRSTAL